MSHPTSDPEAPPRTLIYGGTGGIGLATARRLRAAGHRLHLVGRRLDALRAAADSLGAGYTEGDVRDPELFSLVAREVGPTLEGLVYAVGNLQLGSLRRFSAPHCVKALEVHAIGAALAVQASLPALQAGSGSVVLYSSVAAQQGFAFHTTMSLCKAAVSGLTLALAAELAPKVRVNAIAPSLTRTPLAQSLLSNEAQATKISDMHALQRLGEPEDVAALTGFLLSRDSAWMTGQVLGLDGGRSTLRAKG